MKSPEEAERLSMPGPDPFTLWKEGIELDRQLKFGDSFSKFKQAAKQFFDLASLETQVARAYYEYSTLMDAYSSIQLARQEISAGGNYDGALLKLDEACRILRSTIHFGFLAPFVSACATAETADLMDREDEDCFQGYKNAIALFEHAKLALSFSDETHPAILIIDAYTKYCISQALLVESLSDARSGNVEASKDKEKRSHLVRREFEVLSKKAELDASGLHRYLVLDDYSRAKSGAFVVSYPDAKGLLLLNLGVNAARLEAIGRVSLECRRLEPKESFQVPSEKLQTGKIRLTYEDIATQEKFNEGCTFLI